MSGVDEWDVWLLSFEPGADPVSGLVQLFGMTQEAAQHIEMTLPRAMKRKLPFDEAKNMLGALERIGAKAELRQHRVESARRSVSRPQMEAVRDSAPTPVGGAAVPARPSPAPATAPAQPAAPAPAPAGGAGAAGRPSPSGPIELPLGTPVGGELSKTPRNVFLAIVAVLFLITIGAVAMSFSGGEEPEALGPVDAEAVALVGGSSMDVRAFLNNSTSGFSGNQREDITPFIDACYAAGVRRMVVADIEDVGGATFAHTLLVELPDDTASAAAIDTARVELLAGRTTGAERGERWLILRFDP